MLVERVVEIDATPETVWAVMADVERWPEWTDSMTEVRRLDEGPLAEGSRVRIKQPRLRPTVMRISALEPSRGFTWENSQPGATTVAVHRIEPNETGGSRVTLVLQMQGLLATVAGALMGGRIRRYVDLEAEGLKRRSEERQLASP